MSDYLPSELLVDILSRLPVVSLLRFRCVSKSWCSLISSHSFVKTYLNRTTVATHTNNAHILLVRHYTREREEHYSLHFDNETLGVYHFELEFPFRSLINEFFRVVGSCNGLICLSDDLVSIINTIILWNPTIKKSVTLPSPRVTFRSHGRYTQVLGFGFDPKTDDYKVVRLAYLEGLDAAYKDPPVVELYSLRTRSWGSISAAVQPYGIPYNSSQTFVNGAVHWLAYDQRRSCYLIVSFSMEDEMFGEMKLPGSLADDSVQNMSIDVVFGESLAVFQNIRSTQNQLCSIWVMNKYNVAESWTKLSTIDIGESFGPCEFVFVLGFRRNGEFLLATGDGKMVSHDPKTQQLKNIGLLGTALEICVRSYLPSLVLLEEANEVLRAQAQSSGADAFEGSSDADASEGASALGEEEGGIEGNTDMEGSNKE